ncbi:MAG: iron chaperone [Thermoplasmata archaeon]
MPAMKSSRPQTVDEYLASVPPKPRAVLQRLRKTIRAAAPHASEVISYGIPGYKQNGMLVYFAAFENHCSFFGIPAMTRALKAELKGYDTSKGTIRFTVDKPLPAALVRRLVKARIAENEARRAGKAKRRG